MTNEPASRERVLAEVGAHVLVEVEARVNSVPAGSARELRHYLKTLVRFWAGGRTERAETIRIAAVAVAMVQALDGEGFQAMKREVVVWAIVDKDGQMFQAFSGNDAEQRARSMTINWAADFPNLAPFQPVRCVGSVEVP